MTHNRLLPLGLILASALIGRAGWSGEPLLLPSALFFPLLWGYAQTRTVVFCISAGYFLAASRGLPAGVANFYAVEAYKGLFLWVGAAGSFAIVHTLCWSDRSQMRRVTGFVIATFLMMVPPFGIAGWANPLTAAGILFPDWGWVGLSFTLFIMLALLTGVRTVTAVALCSIWLWSAMNWTSASAPQSWTGVDTHFHQALGRGFELDQQWQIIRTMQLAAVSSQARVVVAPESAAGFWTFTSQTLWQQAAMKSGVTFVVGATIIRDNGYDNTMIAVDRTGAQTLYRQRMPVPVSMWQPWLTWFGQKGGAKADFFDNPVVMIGENRAAILLCYEQLVIWPVLQSMLYKPDILVAAGNGWWTEGTSIVAIQRTNTIAWAKLFGTPVVFSFNT
jgi:hypothetical protein